MPPTVFGRIQLLLVYMIDSSLSTKNTNKKRTKHSAWFYPFLNYREATSTLTPGPKVVVTATLRTY